MLNLTLTHSDSIATILPIIELAMHTGAPCRIDNIHYLGQIQLAALTLLAMSQNLLDSATGRIIHPQPGFSLLGVDDRGVAQTLVR